MQTMIGSHVITWHRVWPGESVFTMDCTCGGIPDKAMMNSKYAIMVERAHVEAVRLTEGGK